MIIFPEAFFCSVRVKINQTERILDFGAAMLSLLLLDVREQQQTEDDCQGYVFLHFFAVGVHCPRQQGDGETMS